MASHIAISPHHPVNDPRYDDPRHDDGRYAAVHEASECARPDLLHQQVERRRQPRPPVPTTGLYRPSLLTSITVCAAVLSSLALML